MSKYDARKENFIRKLMIVKNINESEARKFYREDYDKASDKQRRKIMRQVKKGIKEKYPEKHPAQERENKGFKKPKVRKPKEEKIKTEHKITQKGKRRKYTPETEKRVKRASKKYPNASNYELRHGYNSIASQEYRKRQRSKNK